MRKKVIHPHPPQIRRMRITCEELAYETCEHLQSISQPTDSAIVLSAIHKFLRGSAPDSIIEFIVQKYFDDCRSYYPEFVCTHSIR